MQPKMTVPNIWLFILGSKEDIKAAKSFVAFNLREYDAVFSTYVPSKAKMLDNVTNRGTAPDVTLPLQENSVRIDRKCQSQHVLID